MNKIIDLSITIQNRDKGELERPYIKYLNHKKGADLLGLAGCILSDKSILKVIKNFFLYILSLRKINHKNFPGGLGLAWERLNISTHCGTHLDAPFHYGLTCDNKPSLTIDKIPLEYCFSDGVVLDFRDKKGGDTITQEELQSRLQKINYTIKPKDIVLIMTGVDKYIHKKNYPFSHPGLDFEAIEWLLNKGVKIIGTDAWSLDRPINFMIKDFFRERNKTVLWPAHLVGRQKEYFHIEKLVNLDKIPAPYGFKVGCFPIKIKDASAAWIRAVAIIED